MFFFLRRFKHSLHVYGINEVGIAPLHSIALSLQSFIICVCTRWDRVNDLNRQIVLHTVAVITLTRLFYYGPLFSEPSFLIRFVAIFGRLLFSTCISMLPNIAQNMLHTITFRWHKSKSHPREKKKTDFMFSFVSFHLTRQNVYYTLRFCSQLLHLISASFFFFITHTYDTRN